MPNNSIIKLKSLKRAILILFIKKYFDNKKNDQNLSDSSVNVMQIEILADKSIDDPILKAKTINEIVTSISTIPDRIKQEIYV